jgi:hypothetical protein
MTSRRLQMFSTVAALVLVIVLPPAEGEESTSL